MNRAAWGLLVVIVLELAGTFFWYRARKPASADEFPRPDLSILDSASAAEILSRQERVRKESTSEAWTDLAAIYLMYGFFHEADACCQRAAELNPGAILNNFWWGTTLYRLGDLQKSSEKFLAAIPPGDPSQGVLSWYCIGLNRLREEQQEEAEKAFRAAAGFPSAEYELAKLLVRSGRADQALPIIEKLTRDDPQSIRYWQLRASAAEELGDLAHVDDFHERADRAPSAYASDELTGFLERQIEKRGLDLMIQNGRRAMDAGQMAEAARILRESLTREWRPLAADLLAEAELALGRPDEAIRVLTGGIERFSATPARLAALGDAWRAKGNVEEGVRYWERSARLSAASPAHARLARHFAEAGDEALATKHQARATHAAGLAAFRQERLQEAAKSFGSAVELDPELAHAWFYLGECRRALDESSAAAQAYERCLEINRNHGRARRSLVRLKTAR